MLRRNLLATSLIAPLAALQTRAAFGFPALPQTGQIGFRMIRHGDEVGRHMLSFERDGGQLKVNVAIDFVIKLGPIPVFRYQHRATERWQDGVFMGIDSQTDHDGEPHFVHAQRQAEGMVVQGSKTARYIAPPGTLPTTYWNKAMLQSHVINSEDGRLFDVSPASLAEEDVPTASGRTIRARHYTMSGDLQLDLWYDAQDQWAHLVFTKDSNTFIYEKL